MAEQVDFDKPDPRVVAELVKMYEQSAARLRQMITAPQGRTASSQKWNATRAAVQLKQVEAEIARLKRQIAGWTGSAIDDALARGRAIADRQLQGIPANDRQIAESFSKVDRRAVEALAKDTASDLLGAADSMQRQAKDALRRMAATGVTNAQVNQILAGGVIEGKPRETIRALRTALDKVHGSRLTVIDKNGDPIEFDSGYYARMVALTKTREATVKARHQRLAERGVDLVIVVGRISGNFCSAYLDKVFSLSGQSDKYPPLSALPGGGPPFHPQCSKSTAPFVEALATDAELEAGEPDPDTDKLLNVADRSTLQQRFQALNLRKVVTERAKTVQPVAGRKGENN